MADGDEAFLGEIAAFGFAYAPRGWALCNGQTMSISQNPALYSLLGTMYGGDGRSTFALPNLQGAFPVNAGAGPGLTPLTQGDVDGTESVTLSSAHMPSHTHDVLAGSVATAPDPAGNVFAPTPSAGFRSSGGLFPLATLPSAGSGLPHENRPPFLVVTYCIALQGAFPQR